MQDGRDGIHHAQPGQLTDGVSLDLALALQLELFACPFQVLGVSRKSSSVTVFTLEGGFIRSAMAVETHSLAVNAHRSAAAQVVSR